VLRGIFTVLFLALCFGGAIKGLGLLTSNERIRVVRQGFFWTAMVVAAIIVTFILTVFF
jgi:hypothetical protein